MAVLELTIIRGTDSAGKTLDNITIKTGSTRESGKLTYYTVYWQRNINDKNWGTTQLATNLKLELNMASISFNKQMYSPNEIVAELQLSPTCPIADYERKAFISNKDLKEFFANKKVEMKCDGISVCTDYYVHDIISSRYSDGQYITLKIYSPDKVMTVTPYSKTFISKRLKAEILKKEISNFTLPYDSTNTVPYDASHMTHLIKDKKEHIFPYLVIYNESFYDFLARTTNRWGEFMYYEGGKLNIGYEEPVFPANETDSISGYSMLKWQDLTDKQPSQKQDALGPYVPEAVYDNNVLKSTVKKDTYDAVKNTIANAFDQEKGADVYWLGKVGQVLTNDKPLSPFITETLIDDLVSYGQVKARVDRNNKRIRENYFDKKSTLGDDHFDGDTYNQFSEASPIVNASIYSTILEGEMKAGKNAIVVEYDTTWPNLTLGQIIKVDNVRYIIVKIEGYQPKVIAQVNNYYDYMYNTSELRYRFTAIPENRGTFYPEVIPAGHIRKAGPQVAVVVDVDDPACNNRVRVKYPWQLKSLIEKVNSKAEKDDDKISSYEGITAEHLKDYDATDASPWLLYATPSGPVKAGVHGRHYLAEKVLVDYAEGNVERPFVVGAVSKDIPVSLKTGSAVLYAPNGESVKVHEGTGKGASTFIAGLNPGLKLIKGFGTFNFGEDWKLSQNFEGGVDIGDKYGIWSIKGSTHDRNISIKSPWGDVKIDAWTGITINAPNGDVKIKGKNVSIEAGNNLTITSGKNIKNRLIKEEGNIFTNVMSAVANKIAQTALSFVDFSIIRSFVETFTRPIEGSLTIKSNRYLRLEAGPGKTYYPDAAYANKKVALAAAKKERLATTNSIFFETNLVPDVNRLLGKCNSFANRATNLFFNRYNQVCEKKLLFDQKIAELKNLSDNSKKPCKSFEELKDTIWANKDGKNFTVDTLSFTEDVNINDVHMVFIDGEIEERAEEVTRIVGLRRTKRTEVLNEMNLMAKDIKKLYKVSEMSLSKNTVEKVLSDPQAYGFAAKTMDKIVEAFPKDVMQSIFALSDELKNLSRKLTDNEKIKMKKILSRKLAIAILEALGFKDENRKKIGGAVPAKPTTNEQLADTEIWTSYVASIDTLPKIGTDPGSILGDATKTVTDAINNITSIVKCKSQLDAWSEAKNGQILFSSGKGTFELTDHIHKYTNLRSEGNVRQEDEPDYKGVSEKIVSLRQTLRSL